MQAADQPLRIWMVPYVCTYMHVKLHTYIHTCTLQGIPLIALNVDRETFRKVCLTLRNQEPPCVSIYICAKTNDMDLYT